MIRIDPTQSHAHPTSADAISTNGQYRIPPTTPSRAPASPGNLRLRLPQPLPLLLRPRRQRHDLIEADVGQNNIEEIDRVTKGGNYGWAVKEGTFLFNRATGTVGAAPGNNSPGSPAGLIDPISGPGGTLEYDHSDGISITGGFVYRGTAIPELFGKYVFGDLALRTAPVRADGRLFYADLEQGTIKEFLLPQFADGVLPNGLTVHGFGQDANGELYALVTNTRTRAGGTGGIVYNAKGSLFAGQASFNADFALRRSLIQFDIASAIHAGSTIENVTLTLNAARSSFGGESSLHRLLSDWGEGTSNAGSSGSGAAATNGDATWLHTFFNFVTPQFWNTPGGDFVPDASSSQFVPGGTFLDTSVQFPSTSLMVQDVQHWLDSGQNFGWLIQGDENRSSGTRFDSREAFFPQNIPVLSIQFSPAVSPQWNVDADGSFGDPNNWAGEVPDSPTAIANFLGVITAPRTITLDGDRTVGTINFDSIHSYTISPGTGGSLTVGDPSQAGVGLIHVAHGSHLVTARVNFASESQIDLDDDSTLALTGGMAIGFNVSVHKTGNGTLHIGGPQQHDSGASLVISGGKVFMNSNPGAPATPSTDASANLYLTIGGNFQGTNSILILNSDVDIAYLQIGHSDEGSQGLDLNSTASTFHQLRIHTTDTDNAQGMIAAAIANEKIFSVGDGLYDSGLHFHANGAIGFGRFLDVNNVPYILVRPTRIGDLNLDGVVSIADFIDLAAHFNQSGLWQEGDINGDGTVTIADFIDLASNFNQSYAGSAIPISPADAQMLTTFAAAHGITLVPEPATLALLLLLPLTRRRVTVRSYS
jgi:hypothetical protein